MSSSKTEAQRDLGEPISEYNRLTGIALLLAIGAVFLLVNFFCAPITTLGPPSFRDGFLLAIYMVMGGVIMAEPVVLLIWLLLGGGSAVGRWGFVTVGLLVLIACLFLGFSFFCLEVVVDAPPEVVVNAPPEVVVEVVDAPSEVVVKLVDLKW